MFKEEGGIRDKLVTGVQTCALPISPGGPFNTFATAPQNLEDCVTPNGHRLQRGLTGYLIPVAPHAFVPHCQTRSS